MPYNMASVVVAMAEKFVDGPLISLMLGMVLLCCPITRPVMVPLDRRARYNVSFQSFNCVTAKCSADEVVGTLLITVSPGSC